MLKYTLIHPKIMEILGRAGHHGRVLIADGNYRHHQRLDPMPNWCHSTCRLALSPAQVLAALVTAIPIERANTMMYETTGPYALDTDPPVWAEYKAMLHKARVEVPLEPIEKWEFYKAVSTPDLVLTIQTADQQRFANLLLSIGVRMD